MGEDPSYSIVRYDSKLETHHRCHSQPLHVQIRLVLKWMCEPKWTLKVLYSQARTRAKWQKGVSSYPAKKHPSRGLCSATFFTHLCSLLAIMLFEMAPKNHPEVLPCVPEKKKTVRYLPDQTRCVKWALFTLWGCGAVSHAVGVNESVIYIQ